MWLYCEVKMILIDHFVNFDINLECFDFSHIKVVDLSVVGLEESKGRPKPSTNSQASDEVTDISVMEFLATFLQFFNLGTEKVETNILFVKNIVKNSTSANAETIFNILTQKKRRVWSAASKYDGAAVMTGARSGVAVHVREVNSQVITFHCLCHKLAPKEHRTLAKATVEDV